MVGFVHEQCIWHYFVSAFNKQINGDSLRILSAQVKDRGVYVCKIDGPAGLAQSSAIVEVESKYFFKIL